MWAFRWQKLMQNHRPPSFFLTNTTALHQALWLGWMAPDSNISCKWFQTSSTNGGGICLNCSLRGVSSVLLSCVLWSGYSPTPLDPMRTHHSIWPGASGQHLPAQGPKNPSHSNPIHQIIYHVFAMSSQSGGMGTLELIHSLLWLGLLRWFRH